MKGLVFTSLFEMVEEKWGDDMVDQLIDDVAPENDGAYTAVGKYPFEEFAAYVTALSKRMDLPFKDCAFAFGQWALPKFLTKVPEDHPEISGSWELIHAVHGVIHVEVIKLYPDAELPDFAIEAIDENACRLSYSSVRPLAHFAHGLLIGAVEHFKDGVNVELVAVSPDCDRAVFVIRRSPA